VSQTPNMIFRLIFGLTLCSSLALAAPQYTITDLGVPPGFTDAVPTAINNHGQVVGWCHADSLTDDVSHAFLWEDGRMLDLGTFGGTESLAEGINDSGEIAGSFVSHGRPYAFIWQAGATVDLGITDGDGYSSRLFSGSRVVSINNSGQVVRSVPTADGKKISSVWGRGQDTYFGLLGDGTICYALHINDRAQIVGVSRRGNSWPSPSSGFLWQNGVLTRLETLGGNEAAADDINDLGAIVGWSYLQNNNLLDAHACVWINGEIQDLGTLGGRYSRAYGINNANQIVGYSQKANNHDTAFLWESGRMFNLNDLVVSNAGYHFKCGDAINDLGQIVVLAWKNGITHALLLSPLSQSTPVADVPAETGAMLVSKNISPVAVPFSLNSFALMPNGDFKLNFTGAVAGNYVIETSTNLTAWAPLGPAMNDHGNWEFVDTNAGKFIMRFYRAVLKQ